jgi:hypothetical protein
MQIARLIIFFTAAFTLVSAIPGSLVAQQFPTNGLAAFYPLHGNAHDASGNGMDATVFGATSAAGRSGIPATAYSFAGNNWIELPDSILPTASPELTISMWVYPFGTNFNSQEVLLDLTTRRGETGLSIMPGGSPYWSFGVHLQTSGWYTAQSPLAAGVWSHVVGVYKQGGHVQLWINGALAQSTSIPDDTLLLLPAYGLNSALGIYDVSGSPYQGFIGIVEGLAIYRRALTPAEVVQLFLPQAIVSPTVVITKAVRPSFGSLALGATYQLQLSSDFLTWTNYGAAFSATNTTMAYPEYWDVVNWNGLFFRLLVGP